MTKKIRKIFRSYQGRHFFSRWARKVFEKQHSQQALGLGLILAVFSFAYLSPQALAMVETNKITQVLPNENPIETTTRITFKFPLETYAISQGFSWYHWGIDLTAPEGEAVYSTAKGKVTEVATALLGYGKYVLIDHQNGQKSLYAHLSKQEVRAGQQVTQETVIGRVGHTGWATGDHLHLEIYQNGLPLNPLEVLPES